MVDSPGAEPDSTRADSAPSGFRDRASPAPGELTRAAITVALLVYLVGLGLSILGNTASGSSALVRTIKGRLFSPWLVPGWLDLGFDYRLTYGMPDDAAHALELRKRGSRGSEAMRLPGPLGGERAARWRRLARAVAVDAAGGESPGALAAAVAAGAFDELTAEDVMLRVLRSPLRDRQDDAPPRRAEQAYAARVRRVAGEVQLLKVEERGEVAPLVSPRRPSARVDGSAPGPQP